MANIRNIRLSLDPHVSGPNAGTADSVVSFDVRWSPQDRASKQPYHVFWGLFGDDTWDNGVEDGVDDSIMVPAAPVLKISHNGEQVSTHEIVTNGLELEWLNEDAGGGYDEIRAKVTHSPLLPTSVTAESNHVNLVL